MARNLIPDICKLLGVEVGEEFKIDKAEGIYKITEQNGLLRKSDLSERWLDYNCYFDELFTETYKIVKTPFKPSHGALFHTFALTNNKLYISERRWINGYIDCLAALKAGWVFRTCKEAEAALPKVAKELGVEYEI